LQTLFPNSDQYQKSLMKMKVADQIRATSLQTSALNMRRLQLNSGPFCMLAFGLNWALAIIHVAKVAGSGFAR
jgi:hypothetical protein